MADIGKLAVSLSLNAAPMTQALTDAQSRLQGFQAAVSSIGGGNVLGIAEGLGKIAGIDLSRNVMDWSKSLAAIPGPVGAAVGAVTTLGPAILDAAKAFGSLVEQGRASAKEQMRLARQFALTNEQAATLQFTFQASGTSLDAMRPALTRYQRALAEAAGGSLEARGKFNQLGISWQELSAMPVNEQLMTLARRFREIPDVAERGRMAMVLFGRGGFEQLEALDRMAQVSSESMRNIARSTRSILSEQDAAKFKALRDSEIRSGTQQSAMSQGFTQQVAVSVAPTMTFANDAFTGLMAVAQPILNHFVDLWNLSLVPLNAVIGLVGEVGKALSPLGDAVVSLLGTVGDLFGGIAGGIGNTVIDAFKALGQVAGWALKTILEPLRWVLVALNHVGGLVRNLVGDMANGLRDVASAFTLGGVHSSAQVAATASTRHPAASSAASAASAAANRALNEEIERQNRQLEAERAGHPAAATPPTAQRRHAAANPEAAAASAQLSEELDRQNQQLLAQFYGMGRASYATEHYTLAQRGATRAQLETNAALHQRNLIRQTEAQRDSAIETINLQLAGLRETVILSMSAADAQLRVRLATEGVARAMIGVESAGQRELENLQRRLQLQIQMRDTAEAQAAQARALALTTQLQTADPLMSSGQAQRQAQIAEMERTAQMAADARDQASARADAQRLADEATQRAAIQANLPGLQADATAIEEAARARATELATLNAMTPQERQAQGIGLAELRQRQQMLDITRRNAAEMRQMADNAAAALNNLPGSEEAEIWAQLEQHENTVAAAADRVAIDLLRVRDAQLAWNEAMEQGRQLTQQMLDPLETFQQRMDQLARMRAMGVDPETINRAAIQASERLQNAFGPESNRGPAAMAIGQAATISAVNAQQREDSRGDVQQRTLQAILQARDVQQQVAANTAIMAQMMQDPDFLAFMQLGGAG